MDWDVVSAAYSTKQGRTRQVETIPKIVDDLRATTRSITEQKGNIPIIKAILPAMRKMRVFSPISSIKASSLRTTWF